MRKEKAECASVSFTTCRLLVGTNLLRLSQIAGLTPQLYAAAVLPRLLEQIITCKDTIAQGYLMDCIVQAFSDECHIAALDLLLDSLSKLKVRL